ncbi:MAG: hypothetical protein K8L99_35585 [Anaerolineae bacterium]|nr:hypothetical protein [Anaerolineae bacterium]
MRIGKVIGGLTTATLLARAECDVTVVKVFIRLQVYPPWRKIVGGASLLVVEGQIERDGAVTNLLASGFRVL